jgi:YVTN family beta-propeller protein
MPSSTANSPVTDDLLRGQLTILLREEAPARAPSGLARSVMQQTQGEKQRRRGLLDWSRIPAPRLVPLTAALGMLAVAAVVVLALLASRSSVAPAATPEPGASATPFAPPTPFPVTAQFPGVGVFPVIADGSVWAPNWDTGTVQRIDTATNEIVATITVGERPHAMAARETASGTEVWVSGRDEVGWAVMKIDPHLNEVVDRIGVGDQGWAMAIDGDTMWLTSFESSRLLRVDLAAREVVKDIRLGNALGVIADSEGAWVALGASGRLAHVLASDNSVTFSQTPAETTSTLSFVGDEVWATTLSDGRVMVLSRESGELTGEIALHFPFGIAEQDGDAWVTDGSNEDPLSFDRILSIDSETREVRREIPMTAFGVDRSILPDGDALWVVGTPGLVRIDRTE